MHDGVDASLRKMCKYQQNVPQYFYHFDTLVLVYISADDTQLSSAFKPGNDHYRRQSRLLHEYVDVLFGLDPLSHLAIDARHHA